MPYVSKLTASLQPGQTLIAHGTVDPDADQFVYIDFSHISGRITQLFGIADRRQLKIPPSDKSFVNKKQSIMIIIDKSKRIIQNNQ